MMQKRVRAAMPSREELRRQCALANDADRRDDPLRELLRAGLGSSPGFVVTPCYWARKRKVLRRRKD